MSQQLKYQSVWTPFAVIYAATIYACYYLRNARVSLLLLIMGSEIFPGSLLLHIIPSSLLRGRNYDIVSANAPTCICIRVVSFAWT